MVNGNNNSSSQKADKKNVQSFALNVIQVQESGVDASFVSMTS